MRFTFTREQEAFRGEVNALPARTRCLPTGRARTTRSTTSAYEFGRAVPEEAGAEALDRARVAEGVRRARAVALGPGDLQRGDGLRARADRQHRRGRLSRADDHPLRHATSRSSSTCPASRRATWCGARATASRTPAPTWRRCRRAPCRTATTSSSTDRRSGRSQAHYADWMFVLARTDPDAPKHRGISYFLMDMKTPGVTRAAADQHGERRGLQRGLLRERAHPARPDCSAS